MAADFSRFATKRAKKELKSLEELDLEGTRKFVSKFETGRFLVFCGSVHYRTEAGAIGVVQDLDPSMSVSQAHKFLKSLNGERIFDGGMYHSNFVLNETTKNGRRGYEMRQYGSAL